MATIRISELAITYDAIARGAGETGTVKPSQLREIRVHAEYWQAIAAHAGERIVEIAPSRWDQIVAARQHLEGPTRGSPLQTLRHVDGALDQSHLLVASLPGGFLPGGIIVPSPKPKLRLKNKT